MVKRIIKSDDEVIEPEKIIKKKKRRTQVIEETIVCPICKEDVIFEIIEKYVDGILKSSERENKSYFHDPLKCLQKVEVDFKTVNEVEKCGNCKQWAGHHRCGEMTDQFCKKHSRKITKEEFDWVKEFYPDKIMSPSGEEKTFKGMQSWYNVLEYVCYEDEWCEHYEDDR